MGEGDSSGAVEPPPGTETIVSPGVEWTLDEVAGEKNKLDAFEGAVDFSYGCLSRVLENEL